MGLFLLRSESPGLFQKYEKYRIIRRRLRVSSWQKNIINIVIIAISHDNSVSTLPGIPAVTTRYLGNVNSSLVFLHMFENKYVRVLLPVEL